MQQVEWEEICYIMETCNKPTEFLEPKHIISMYEYIKFLKKEDKDSNRFTMEAVVNDYLGVKDYVGTA